MKQKYHVIDLTISHYIETYLDFPDYQICSEQNPEILHIVQILHTSLNIFQEGRNVIENTKTVR